MLPASVPAASPHANTAGELRKWPFAEKHKMCLSHCFVELSLLIVCSTLHQTNVSPLCHRANKHQEAAAVCNTRSRNVPQTNPAALDFKNTMHHAEAKASILQRNHLKKQAPAANDQIISIAYRSQATVGNNFWTMFTQSGINNTRAHNYELPFNLAVETGP